MEPRIFNRHSRLRRQQNGDRLVLGVEFGGIDLLGEIEISEHAAGARHGNAEERLHRRVMRGKTEALEVAVDVGRTDRLALPDHLTEEPAAAGEIADLLARRLVETGGDELHQRLPVVPQDAEGGVAGAHDVARGIHHLLQHMLDVVPREDRDARSEQSLESFPNAGRFEM